MEKAGKVTAAPVLALAKPAFEEGSPREKGGILDSGQDSVSARRLTLAANDVRTNEGAMQFTRMAGDNSAASVRVSPL